ncbi:WD repeat-containing protein [Ooceraea biroi]|uniref:WD repeat-containing protein n=1 Tax=Ooceraea biroi TaxID=2015173 RepID=A0A026WGC3_OOCBI|nr:WD repeat-containing protein [Ooceraea biroi]
MEDRDIDRTDKPDSQTRDTVPVVSAIIVSGRDHSHEQLIRRIQWLPDNYRIEPSGKLTKLSTSSSCQFMTISEDGIGHFSCCSWEGQVLDVETSGLEQCKVLDGFFAHDGPVIGIFRSPHLEDVLLTVGGHLFAIWKDDFLDMPLFRRKSNCIYTACCWSNRPGVFVMGTGQGDLEVWDIRRRANEPVFTRTISRKPITVLSLQDSCKNGLKLIGAGDCSSIFHIFEESMDFDDTVERMDWFEEYVWREVRRKKMFLAWQKDFLQTDPQAIARRQAREEEERKSKLEMTRQKLQKEHEERLKMEAEEKARQVVKPKDVKWKLRQQKRMEEALLEKKRFVPRELEEKRQPLVSLAEERNIKMTKARNEAALQDNYFDNFVSVQLPEYINLLEESESPKEDTEREETEPNEEEVQEYLQKFYEFREELQKMLAEKSYVPEFNLKTFMKIVKERMEESMENS